MQKTLALCVNWACGQCANHLGRDACTDAVLERPERSRNGPGTVPERSRNRFGDVTTGMAARRFRKVWIAWQAQHFRKVK